MTTKRGEIAASIEAATKYVQRYRSASRTEQRRGFVAAPEVYRLAKGLLLMAKLMEKKS